MTAAARRGQDLAPVFHDDFDAPTLDLSRWLPEYLPHWTTPGRAGATCRIADSVLRLTIAPDQPAWLPDLEGPLRVSNLQTGHWSGPLGSQLGQHRSRDGLVVRTERPPLRLFTPTYGHLTLRARATLPPGTCAALWLIGYEDEPDRSGEITVMEVFGDTVAPEAFILGHGIKAIRDPALVTEFHQTRIAGRVSDWHDYAMTWTPNGVTVTCDGRLLSHSRQSPAYPMQLMLNLYDLTGAASAHDARFEIDLIRMTAAGDAP